MTRSKSWLHEHSPCEDRRPLRGRRKSKCCVHMSLVQWFSSLILDSRSEFNRVTCGLHLHYRLHSAGFSPASDLAGPCGSAGAPPFPRRSPTAVLPPLPTPFSYYPPPHSLSPLTHPSIPPLAPSRGPILNRHTLTPPGPSRGLGGDQALLDSGVHQRHLIP